MGMSKGLSWPVVGRMAALTAVYAIEHHGTQEHSYSIKEFVARYNQNYEASSEIESLSPGVGASRDPGPTPVLSARSEDHRRQACQCSVWAPNRSSLRPIWPSREGVLALGGDLRRVGC